MCTAAAAWFALSRREDLQQDLEAGLKPRPGQRIEWVEPLSQMCFG